MGLSSARPQRITDTQGGSTGSGAPASDPVDLGNADTAAEQTDRSAVEHNVMATGTRYVTWRG